MNHWPEKSQKREDTLLKRVLSIFARKPDIIIGGKQNPYLLRWYIIPRNRLFNVYLHKFLRDDDDRALHDHPWLSLSLILKGGYFEYLPDDRIRIYFKGAFIFRRALHRHRIVLFRDFTTDLTMPGCRRYHAVPAWNLFITGPRIREWGFWCEGKRFIPWDKFTDPKDSGSIGKGCNQ